jgi:hypothetical protein
MECDMNDYYCINELFQERRHSVFKLILLPLKIHYMERTFTEDQRQSISFKGCYAVFKIALSSRQTIICKYVGWEVLTVVYMKLTAVWNVMRCSLVYKKRRMSENSSTVKIRTAGASEPSLHIYLTTQHHTPEVANHRL